MKVFIVLLFLLSFTLNLKIEKFEPISFITCILKSETLSDYDKNDKLVRREKNTYDTSEQITDKVLLQKIFDEDGNLISQSTDTTKYELGEIVELIADNSEFTYDDDSGKINEILLPKNMDIYKVQFIIGIIEDVTPKLKRNKTEDLFSGINVEV